mgnify:CR=1 FL=1
MKTNHYHNTNKLDELTSRLEARKNVRQEDLIYEIFITFEEKKTASEVWNHYGPKVPLTSIRRGISNLMREGVLEKTNETKIGIYGKPEHFYQLSQLKLNETEITTKA